ncbi:hypothetical protein HY641_04825 [Candidatus Woesearchaeota archaeon]|nr:hypothetical protein [Candidatus Woesearchaeota archaeon]
MFGKFKEAMHVKEDLDALRTELAEHKKLVTELSSEYKKQITELSKKNKDQEDLIIGLTKDLTMFRKDLSSEINSFQAISKGVQKQILEKFEKELTNQFLKYGKELEMDKNAYIKIKTDVETAAKSLASLNANVARIAEVAGAIRKEDFELTQHHKMLLSADKEKVELLAKIDSLERLMAAMQKGRGEARRKAPYA